MKYALAASLAYLALAVALHGLVNDGAGVAISMSLVSAASNFQSNLFLLGGAVALFAAALILSPGGPGVLRRLNCTLFVILATQAAYSVIKGDMTLLAPLLGQPAFFAEVPLARLDAWLHGSVQPWRILHEAVPEMPMWIADRLYLTSWTAIALGLPIIAVATDADETRRMQVIWLWVGIWFVLGNVMALAGLSGGPVYHDRITGLDTFADLGAAQAAAGIEAANAGRIMNALWEYHQVEPKVLGASISAFPSMHVAAATLAACYLSERMAWLSPLFWGWALAILFLSVWQGWHYAIDGYASMALVGAAWALLRRRARRSAPMGRGVAAPATA